MVKQCDDRIVCQTCLDVFSLLFEAIPVTVPHENEVVPGRTGGQRFGKSGFIELAKGTGRDVFALATGFTHTVESIYFQGTCRGLDSLFAVVACM